MLEHQRPSASNPVVVVSAQSHMRGVSHDRTAALPGGGAWPGWGASHDRWGGHAAGGAAIDALLHYGDECVEDLSRVTIERLGDHAFRHPAEGFAC